MSRLHRGVGVVTGLACLLGLALPAVASAAGTITEAGLPPTPIYVFTAGAGDDNDITVTQTGDWSTGSFVFTDSVTISSAPAGCTGTPGTTVTCPTATHYINLHLGDQDDEGTVGGGFTAIGVSIFGEAGADDLTGNTASGDQLTGDAGEDTINGGPGNDGDLSGGDDSDVINGGGGIDDIDGGAGPDVIDGEGGDDFEISGGEGEDVLHGGIGDDALFDGGDADVDVLDGGTGADVLAGTDDLDICDYSSRSAPVTVTLNNNEDDGEAGEGDVCATGGAYGGAAADTLTGNNFSDNVFDGGHGTDVMNGGSGNDSCDYASRTNLVTVHLEDSLANDGEAGENDQCLNMENSRGGSAADVLIGGAGANVLTGGGGFDAILGGDGSDQLDGGSGGGALDGGAAADLMFNGFCDYSGRTNPIVVTTDGTADDGESGESDDCSNVGPEASGAIGGSGDDVLFGSKNFAETFDGGGGTDTLSGGPADDAPGSTADVLIGGAGPEDVCDYSERTAPITVTTNSGADDGESGELDDCQAEGAIGGSDADSLTGDAGDNYFDGGPGGTVTDVLNGAGGTNDTCSYATHTGVVSVTLNDATANEGEAGENEDCVGMENATGGSNNDTLTGNGVANLLDGGPGNEVLTGGGGIDTCSYSKRVTGVQVSIDGAANDGESGETDNCLTENIRGGSANDQMTGDGGPNVLDGGSGADSCNYAARTTDLIVSLDGQPNDGDPGELDNCLNAENVSSGSGNDTLTGNGQANALTGGGGGDTITGGAGSDTISNGTGANSIFARDGEVDQVICVTGGASDSIISDFASPVDTLTSCGSAKLNDADNDGVSEPADQCPSVSAPGQANGCPAAPPPSGGSTPPAATAPIRCPKGKKLVKGKCVKKKKKKRK
jgi:Ca2+-binding RTX toxin-like protein